MKNSIVTWVAAIGLFATAACTQQKKQHTEGNEPVQTILQVDDLLDEAENLVDQTVTVEGVCTHICAHGGKKLFLMGSDDTKTIRVEATDETGAFSKDCVNSMVSVTGIVKETRIDEAYLAKWKAEEKTKSGEQHGEAGSAGCETDQKAQNETPVNTVEERIANFRTRIAQEKEATGKDWLSFYFIEADSYTIQ